MFPMDVTIWSCKYTSLSASRLNKVPLDRFLYSFWHFDHILPPSLVQGKDRNKPNYSHERCGLMPCSYGLFTLRLALQLK